LDSITTNRKDYVPYDLSKLDNKPILPKIVGRNIKFEKIPFDGKTIYMTDYTEKELPDPDENKCPYAF